LVSVLRISTWSRPFIIRLPIMFNNLENNKNVKKEKKEGKKEGKRGRHVLSY